MVLPSITITITFLKFQSITITITSKFSSIYYFSITSITLVTIMSVSVQPLQAAILLRTCPNMILAVEWGAKHQH